jgi:hypothetical protein
LNRGVFIGIHSRLFQGRSQFQLFLSYSPAIITRSHYSLQNQQCCHYTHLPIHFRLASFQVHTRFLFHSLHMASIDDKTTICLLFGCILGFLSVASMASTHDQNRGSWKTPSRLLKCNTKLCQGSSGTSEEHWTSFSFVANISAPFLADITCGECQDSFSVCLECPRATSQLRTKEQIKRHCRHAHRDWFELMRSRAPKQKSQPNGTVEPSTKRRRPLPSSADHLETVGAKNNSALEDALIPEGENDFFNGME